MKREIEPVIAKAIAEAEVNLLQRLGVNPTKLDDVQKDFAFVRSQREIREAVIKQGIGAVVLALLAGLATAIGFWFKSGMPR